MDNDFLRFTLHEIPKVVIAFDGEKFGLTDKLDEC